MEYLRSYLKREDPNFAPNQNGYDLTWATEVFYEAAFISALFHDMGYPWQYVNSLSKSITGSNYEEINGALLNVTETANKMNESLLIYPLYGYDEGVVQNHTPEQEQQALEMIRKGLLNKHGMPGAMGFMYQTLMSMADSGAIMAADNILALFLLPCSFGSATLPLK